MRADQLKASIKEIRDIFSAAGSAAAEADFERLEKYIDLHGNRDLDDLLSEISAKLDPALYKKQAVSRYVDKLKSAGFDESKFKAALQSIKEDKTMDKNDTLQIAKFFGVIRISGRSKPSYLEFDRQALLLVPL